MPTSPNPTPPLRERLGRFTLRGQLMPAPNPWAMSSLATPHGSVLAVRNAAGRITYFFLETVGGLAEAPGTTLEVAGDLERQGDALVLRTHPADIRRLTAG